MKIKKPPSISYVPINVNVCKVKRDLPHVLYEGDIKKYEEINIHQYRKVKGNSHHSRGTKTNTTLLSYFILMHAWTEKNGPVVLEGNLWMLADGGRRHHEDSMDSR